MLAIERFRPTPSVRQVDDTPNVQALGVGVCQALAIVPGVSRSGGDDRGRAGHRARSGRGDGVLVLPRDADADGGVRARVSGRCGTISTGAQGSEIAIGFVTAFLSSALVVKPFLNFVSRSGFQSFAWYRIVAGLVLLAALASGWGRSA